MFFRRPRDMFADPIPLPPDLTGFADRVGRLEREHEIAGYLRVIHDIRVIKHWGKPYEKPFEVLKFSAVMVDPAGDVTDYVDEIYDEAEARDELAIGVLRLPDIDYDIVWLDDANAAAVLAKFF